MPWINGKDSEMNEDEISNDVAVTEFCTTYDTLCHSFHSTPDFVSAAVDELVDTLNNCVTRVTTLNEIVRHVIDYVAVDPGAHYFSAVLLFKLVEKFTREIEGASFAGLVESRMQTISGSCVAMVENLSKGNVDRYHVQIGRNLALFYSHFMPKFLDHSNYQTWIVSSIFGLEKMVSAFMGDGPGIPRDDLLKNSQCAILMIKLAGPAVDQLIRQDSSMPQDVKNAVSKMYSSVRRLLVSSDNLSPGIREAIVKVLEFRATRWGEFPPPNQRVSGSEPIVGVDEVDPLCHPNNLSQEETDFLNEAVDELHLNEENYGDGNTYDQETYGYPEGNGYDNEQYGDVDRRPIWEREVLPSGAMEEFRLSLKPKFEPDAAGDRCDDRFNRRAN